MLHASLVQEGAELRHYLPFLEQKLAEDQERLKDKLGVMEQMRRDRDACQQFANDICARWTAGSQARLASFPH
ncbi:hypothetical protein M5689_000795 [Euphorbia peplus]|nr:hypothetical protein M5689_000795 [Euphorbia peplus]